MRQFSTGDENGLGALGWVVFIVGLTLLNAWGLFGRVPTVALVIFVAVGFAGALAVILSRK